MSSDENELNASAQGTPPTPSSEQFQELITQFAEMNKVMHANSQRSTGNSGLTIEPFHGLPTEDANLWLDKFDAWIAFHGWQKDDDKIASAMRLKMEGGALAWFNAAPAGTKKKSGQLFKAFKEHFSDLHPTWMLEQQLYERCMLPQESLKSYITDIERR